MYFTGLLNKQKEQSESVARFIVAGGKRRFLIRASLPAGIIPWLAMNLFFFARFRSEGIGGSFLAGLEVITLLISMLFGILISLRMWKRFEQNAKSG
jgi:hypothetical protein